MRARWLPVEGLTVRRATLDSSLRITWADGRSSVEVNLYEKGAAKGQVTVQHTRLADAEQVERMRAYWREALERLARAMQVEPASRA